MSKTFVALSLVGGSLLLFSLHATGGQDVAPDLAKRITELEKRVAKLERLLLVDALASTSTVSEAEAKLVAAEERLQYSQRLHGKGYVSKTDLDADRAGVLKARRQLELAKAAQDDITKVLEIEVLEAEHNLAVATQRLEYTERLAAKNYATEAAVKAEKLTVEKAFKELVRVEAKLQVHQEPTKGSRDDEKKD